MQLKEAVQSAKDHLPEFFPTAETHGLRLEGAGLSDDGATWLVSFSFFEQPSEENPLREMMHLLPRRAYKTFRIQRADGEFLGFRDGLPDAA